MHDADQSYTLEAPLFDWVTVPAGVCLIGEHALGLAPARPGEVPAALIELPGYAIARAPVTNAQYAVFVAATGYRAPAHWEGLVPPTTLAQHPVTYVDWHDARAFCAWAGVRLPSEAEWEKAARGDDGRPIPWGADLPGPLFANCDGRFGATTAVGSFPDGASPYGALDMAGNVWEWTASLYRPYPYCCDDGRENLTSVGQRVLRGGSFRSLHERYLHCAFRSRSYPARRRDHIGFRVARLR